jgi:hypothetical protein
LCRGDLVRCPRAKNVPISRTGSGRPIEAGLLAPWTFWPVILSKAADFFKNYPAVMAAIPRFDHFESRKKRPF